MHSSRVKYELQEIEQIISSVARIRSAKRAGFEAIENNIQAELDRIRLTLINEIFGLCDERHLERYIQYHQRALIRLMDESVRCINTTESIVRKVYQQCYRMLADLLRFIEKHFAKYFDQNAKAPESYIAMVKNDMQAAIEVLDKDLLARDAGVEVTQAVLYALRRIADANHEVTYREVLYAKELEGELSALISNHSSGVNIDDELRSLMWYINNNSAFAFTCNTQHIDAVVNEAETRNEKIEKLSYFLKRVNQAQVKPGMGYNVYAMPLTDQLKAYIKEEIEHLQRIHHLAPSANTAHVFSSAKIQLEMSVAQAACLIRLLVDSKVIVNGNVTELLRFLAGCMVSKRVEAVSYDSLRAKYYNVEQSTRDAVKNNLLKMLTLIDKNY